MIPVDPKPFQKINKTLLGAILFAIIFLGGYGYFFCLVKDTRANVAILTKETEVLAAEESESAQIKKELSDTESRRSVLVSYFVDVNNPVPFEETIEGYGKKTNTNVLFEGLEVKKAPSRLDTSFTVDGSFSDLYRFFALLESAPYELSINNIDLQTSVPSGFVPTGKGPHSANDWQARISLSVYSVTGVSN